MFDSKAFEVFERKLGKAKAFGTFKMAKKQRLEAYRFLGFGLRLPLPKKSFLSFRLSFHAMQKVFLCLKNLEKSKTPQNLLVQIHSAHFYCQSVTLFHC